MNKHWLFVLILLLGNNTLRAQMEIIGMAGTCNYLGDLGGKGAPGTPDLLDIDLQGTRFVSGLGLRYNIANTFGLRVLGYYGRINGDDKYTNYAPRRDRNLNFNSPVYGVDATVELHLFKSRHEHLGPYLFGGAGIFRFNPTTKYNGRIVELQRLGTEGQYFMSGKSPYKLTSISLPFGFGWKFAALHNGYLAVELTARKSFTDYLDDVSTQYPDKTLLLASNGQTAVDLSDRNISPDPNYSAPGAIRGKSGNNDTYFFFSISYNHYFGNKVSSGKKSIKSKNKTKRKYQKCFKF